MRFASLIGAADDGAAAERRAEPRASGRRAPHARRFAAVWDRLEPEQRALLSLHAEGNGLGELAAIFGSNRTR